MALRQAIRRTVTELFEAIPERIEVAGHRPTWRVTGGSLEGVLDYVAEALDGAVVVAREDRSRWWPRVTLTVTTDPELAAAAPPLDAFADPEPEPEPPATAPAPEPADDDPGDRPAVLEEMFAYQEDVRRQRLGERR